MSKTFKLIVASILCSFNLSTIAYAGEPIPIKHGSVQQNPIRKAPTNIPIPFSASLESSFITYQSTISYTGVTVEIEDENGFVVESQTLNIVAGTAYTISVTGLDAGEYSIA
jgi:hypothetical protein